MTLASPLSVFFQTHPLTTTLSPLMLQRMEMDITTNWLQHTATKLKTLCTRFLSLDDTQRLIAVPERMAN